MAAIILGAILCAGALYIAAGVFCASALSGARWVEFVVVTFRIIVILAVVLGCVVGGPWLLLSGLGVL